MHLGGRARMHVPSFSRRGRQVLPGQQRNSRQHENGSLHCLCRLSLAPRVHALTQNTPCYPARPSHAGSLRPVTQCASRLLCHAPPWPVASMTTREPEHTCSHGPANNHSGARSRLWSGAAVAPRHRPSWHSLAGWRCANARRVPTPAGTNARRVTTSAAHRRPLHTNTRWVQRRRSVVVYTTDSRPRRGLLPSCIHGCPRHSSCGDMRWGVLRLAAPFTPLRPASRRVVPFHATSRGLSTSIR